jgi:hypothetical protein
MSAECKRLPFFQSRSWFLLGISTFILRPKHIHNKLHTEDFFSRSEQSLVYQKILHLLWIQKVC